MTLELLTYWENAKSNILLHLHRSARVAWSSHSGFGGPVVAWGVLGTRMNGGTLPTPILVAYALACNWCSVLHERVRGREGERKCECGEGVWGWGHRGVALDVRP